MPEHINARPGERVGEGIFWDEKNDRTNTSMGDLYQS